MVINSLNLENFRNYTSFSSQFSPGINFIYGKNGQGKTNLIESLYVITHLRSFRTSHVSEMEMFSQNSSSIRATLSKKGVSHEVAIDFQKNQKKVILDQKKVSYTSDYIKNFFSILFSPDQLVFFKEYPSEKRSFFDRVLILIDHNYFKLIKDFNRIKKQKNQLLRQGDRKTIIVWNKLLASLIPKISEARKFFIDCINESLTAIFTELTGRKEKLELFYKSDFDSRTNQDEASIFDFLQSKLNTEIEKGFLCYGPHKDLFWLTLDRKIDKQAFSQGEYRITFLALQFAINLKVKERLGFNPIILLDDIFSELDHDVFDRTINYIYQSSNQIFITSTEVPERFHSKGTSYKIDHGFLETN